MADANLVLFFYWLSCNISMLIGSTLPGSAAFLLHWECFAYWQRICSLSISGFWAKEESEYCKFGSWSGTFLLFILSNLNALPLLDETRGFFLDAVLEYHLLFDVVIRLKVHQNWKGLCKQFSLLEMLWTRELLEVGKHLFYFQAYLLLIS